MDRISEDIWQIDGVGEGPSLAISFSVHGNERAPIVAGLRLRDALESGSLVLARGRLLLIHANPRASAIEQRWSEGGVDLNRCFHSSVMDRDPVLYEERRAHQIAAALTGAESEILVDFHCTVEPGERFLMHHPPVANAAHRAVVRLLEADVLLADPSLQFGGVSLDEWMTTRDRVGICYETGWIGDPANTPENVHREMMNLLAGLGMIEKTPRHYDEKRFLELDRVLRCEAEGFRWTDGVGKNLQEVPAATVLGAYGDGTPVTLEADAVLIFPKKKPELVKVGGPLVFLATQKT